MSSRGLSVAIVVLAGLLAWLVLQARGPEMPGAPVRASAPEQRTAGDVAEPAVVEEARRAAVREPERSEVENATPASPATAARARFVDERGNPLAGVELRVREDAAALARSGADGTAELGLDGAQPPAGLLTFDARCAGFAREERRATAEVGKVLLLGEWTLVRAGVVEGRVLDERGQGLAAARVAVLRLDIEEGEWEARRRDELEGLWRPPVQAEAGPDGTFVLEDVPCGVLWLLAVADERPATRERVRVPPGGVARDVVLRMEGAEGGTDIAGVVLDPERQPVAGAPVSISGGGSSYQVRAAQDGRFRVQLGDRKPRDVTAFDPAQRLREASARGVVPGAGELVLQLARGPELALEVRSSAGAPVARFAVAVLAVDGGSLLAAWPEGDVPGGRFVLAVPSQDFRVEVHANGWLPARLGPYRAAAPPERVEARLDPAGGISGVVVAGGAPLAGARVALHAALRTNDTYNGFPIRMQTSPLVETASGADGSFALSVQEAGSYYVRASAEGFAPAELGPLALAPASRREERVELGPGGALEVRVRSSEGASVAGRLVALSRGDGRARTVRTDELGLVLLSHLTPGAWQVQLAEKEIDPDFGATRFGTKPLGELPANCRVLAGETTRVDLWLEEGEGECRVIGRLVLDGKPAEGWLAGLDQEREAVVEPAVFAEPGAFRLGVDEPGAYRLSLRTDASDPSAMLLVFDRLELVEGERYWSLERAGPELEGPVVLALDELETGALEGAHEPSTDGSIVFYRWQRGTLECYAPLVPDAAGRFRCARVPAGHGALVRVDPDRPIEEQTPVVLRELTVEAGKTTSVER